MFDFPWFNEQVRPFGIVSVDCEGSFSTYCRYSVQMPFEIVLREVEQALGVAD